ncbi:recombinase family protein [Micromonospora olivasterospora]|uniref:DNA invertase Pin-like site-specific DNA recombinase n=1 Tax=Micromonospora olivasterospora TaxID=1880 RepID=A0A562ICK8_MICOL|nr:recombinase family protein [Micromonospora olivasterospora]TWH68445.1 DNA invertase Pin-like site-specific DNA recombinase [Micromonospora olivasterospora]
MTAASPATYVRQSSARRNKSEASPETQRAATGERAAYDHPGREVRRYEDIGKSGYDTEVIRPDYDRLIADIKAGLVTHVYVYYVSRLTRQNPKQALAELLPLLAGGLTIVSTTEGTFGPDNTMDLIHLLLRLDAAHNESANKSNAVRGAKALARAAGGHVGMAPFGFTTVERVERTPDGAPVAIRALVAEPTEARALRLAARAVRWGHAVHAVSRYFDRRGIATRGATVGRSRAASAWSDRALALRLRDPRIAGLAAVAIKNAKGDTTGYGLATGVPGENALPAPDTAIITPDEFWSLQSALNGRASMPRRPGDTPSLLSGLGILFCECGCPMKSRRFNAAPTRNAYQCSAPAGRHSCTVSMATLDAYVRFRIGRLIGSVDPADPGDRETADVLAEAARRFAAAHADPATVAQRAAVAAELSEATASLDRLAKTLATASGAAARVVEQQVTAAGARVDALTASLAALDAAAVPAVPLTGWTSGEYGDDGAWWDTAPIAERREFVALFIDRLTVRRAAAKGGRPTHADPWGIVAPRVEFLWAQPTSD